MKTSFNHTAKYGDIEEKSKSPHEASTHTHDQNQGQPTFKRQVLHILSQNPLQTYKAMQQHFTPLRLPINEIFNTIKDQPWIRHPRPFQYDPSLFKAEEYCSYATRNVRPPTTGPSRSTYGLLKSTSSLPMQPPHPDSSMLHRPASHNT